MRQNLNPVNLILYVSCHGLREIKVKLVLFVAVNGKATLKILIVDIDTHYVLHSVRIL